MLHRMYKGERPGDAGCSKCGLRASSKNVVIRSVFAVWPDGMDSPSMYEHLVAVHHYEGHPFWSCKPGAVLEGKTPEETFAGIVRYGVEHDVLDIYLCNHSWKQDPGTATV